MLNRYMLAMNGAVVQRYVRSVLSQESVRLLFGLRSYSALLLEDKTRCKII